MARQSLAEFVLELERRGTVRLCSKIETEAVGNAGLAPRAQAPALGQALPASGKVKAFATRLFHHAAKVNAKQYRVPAVNLIVQ